MIGEQQWWQKNETVFAISQEHKVKEQKGKNLVRKVQRKMTVLCKQVLATRLSLHSFQCKAVKKELTMREEQRRRRTKKRDVVSSL